jgi:hypothetical protein
MSTPAEIAQVHKSESKFRLKPHLAPPSPTATQQGPLCVSLAELLGPELVAKLRGLGIVQ